MLHPWHGVSCGENAPDIVTAVIEVPKGSQTKYELDKLSGLLKVDRILYSAVHYPRQLRFYSAKLLRRQRPARRSGFVPGIGFAAFVDEGAAYRRYEDD